MPGGARWAGNPRIPASGTADPLPRRHYRRLTVIVADLVTPAWVADIVADTFFPVFAVTTVKVCDVAPAGTTMLAGTDARERCDVPRRTTAPPLGAGAVSVTVAVEDVPPATLAGSRPRAASAAGADGSTVNVVDFVTPL